MLLSAPEDCKALEAQVKGAVVAAIKSKSQLLPRPSELAEDIIVFFDENLLRQVTYVRNCSISRNDAVQI